MGAWQVLEDLGQKQRVALRPQLSPDPGCSFPLGEPWNSMCGYCALHSSYTLALLIISSQLPKIGEGGVLPMLLKSGSRGKIIHLSTFTNWPMKGPDP
jgi:hypothetical protein